MGEYNIVQLGRYADEKEIIRGAYVLSESFKNTPLFKDFLFQDRITKLNEFMLLVTKYYVQTGHVYVLYRQEDLQKENPLAIALWNTPGDIEMSLRGLIKTHLFKDTIKVGRQIGIASLKRLFMFMNMEEKHRVPGDLTYLFMVGSIQKGCGALLLKENIARFENQDLYLESSVSKNNHVYYKRFGFEMVSRELYQGIDNAFFIKKANGLTISTKMS